MRKKEDLSLRNDVDVDGAGFSVEDVPQNLSRKITYFPHNLHIEPLLDVTNLFADGHIQFTLTSNFFNRMHSSSMVFAA